MGQTHDEITQNLAERLCWEVARRDDSRVARRLYRKQLVDGVYRLDEGALLDDFFHFLQAIGVMGLLEEAHGTAMHREMVPFVQYVLLYGVKTLFGIESINALPRLLFSDEAVPELLMPAIDGSIGELRDLVPLDIRVNSLQDGVEIAAVEGRICTPDDLDVLLGHRPSLGTRPTSER